MARLVSLGAPIAPASGPAGQVITPNGPAARLRRVAPVSLDDLARQRLRQLGWDRAPGLWAMQALESVMRYDLELPDPVGRARTWAPAIRELMRAGVSEAALIGREQPRWTLLGRALQAYRERLAEHRFLDSADVLQWLSRQSLKASPLRIEGYPRLSETELRFIDRLAGDGSVVCLPLDQAPLFQTGTDAAAFLAERGWVIERGPAAAAAAWATGLLAGAPMPPTTAQRHASPDEEVASVLAQVKTLLAAGVPAAQIVLVARDERRYGPLVLATAWEYDLSVRALYGVPIQETRLGSWLDRLVTAVEGQFPYEDTLRLLRHRLGPGLSAADWTTVRWARPIGPEAWRPFGLPEVLTDWPETAGRHAWYARLGSVLTTLGVRKPLRHWAREMLAWEALSDALSEACRWPDAPMTLPAFAAELRERLQGLTVPVQPGRGGVALHTPLSLFGARVEHLFVLGLADGLTPPPLADDPVLDFHDRRALRAAGVPLEIAEEGARREALSFWAMTQAASRQIVLTMPASVDGREAMPSPFLGTLVLQAPPMLPPASDEAWRRLALGAAAPTGDAVLGRAREAWQIEGRREGPAPADEHDGVFGTAVGWEARTFSASQLTSLGQCPFQWFSRSLLRLKEVPETEAEIDPGLRGTLCHDTLEGAMKAHLAKPDGRSVRTGVLLHLGAAFTAAETRLNLPSWPAWSIRRLDLLKLLRRAVASDDFLADGAEVIACERDFVGDWHGLPVTGRIDRVDRTPAGIVFMDYKTGSSLPKGAKDDTGKAALDVQLPLYREAAGPSLYPGETIGEGVYFSLAKAKAMTKAKGIPQVGEAFAEAVKGRFAAGAFPVAPDRDRVACCYCDYDLVCRQGRRLFAKEAP